MQLSGDWFADMFYPSYREQAKRKNIYYLDCVTSPSGHVDISQTKSPSRADRIINARFAFENPKATERLTEVRRFRNAITGETVAISGKIVITPKMAFNEYLNSAKIFIKNFMKYWKL